MPRKLYLMAFLLENTIFLSGFNRLKLVTLSVYNRYLDIKIPLSIDYITYWQPVLKAIKMLKLQGTPRFGK